MENKNISINISALLTDQEIANSIGEKIAKELQLKKNKHTGRYDLLTFGDKTNAGLARTIFRIFEGREELNLPLGKK